VQTDYQGVVEQTCTNLPYGNGETCTGDPSGYLFAGLEQGDNPGLENAMFRQYASAFGQWTTPDPYGGSYDWSNPQSLNRYAYVGGSPLAMRDPSGLTSCYGAQNIYVSYPPLSILGATPLIVNCGLQVAESVTVQGMFSHLFPGASSLSIPILGTVAPFISVGLSIYEFGKSFGLWGGGSSFHGNVAASQSGKSVPSSGSVNVPGPEAPNSGECDNACQLAHALNKTGAFTINDPRFVAGFYGASLTAATGAFAVTDLAAGAEGSLLFGRGYYGWTGFLNGNAPWGSAIRIGFGWNGAQQVFRIAGNLISGNGHIDLWPPSAW
jgi:RHS repeat-associated protein